jgi:hypothetical protein
VLARDARHVKALFRAGCAARELGDKDAAAAFFRRLLEVEPTSEAAAKALAEVVPVAPAAMSIATPLEFERLWQESERGANEEAWSAVVRSLDASRLPEFFGAPGSLTPEHLEGILYALSTRVAREAPEHACELLAQLPLTSRFDLNLMLLSSKARSSLDATFRALAKDEGRVSKAQIARLKSVWA